MIKEFFKDWRVWAVIALLGALWLLSGCTKPEPLEPSLTRRTVQQGKSDFVPNHTFLPGEARTIDGAAKFHASCWYNNLGVDNRDWNKLIGAYRYADGLKNKNSFILAWRPDPLPGTFQLCLYENIAGANVPHESAIYKIKADQIFRFTLEEINGKYTLYLDGIFIDTQRNDKLFKIIGIVSTWFGGTSKAPWMMWLWMDIN